MTNSLLTKQEVREFRKTYSTSAQLDELVELTKDEPQLVKENVAKILGITASALYILKMESKHNIKISI